LKKNRPMRHDSHPSTPWRPIENYYYGYLHGWQPTRKWRGLADWEDDHVDILGREPGDIAQQFNDLYMLHGGWKSTSWAGVNTSKPPTDLWIYQQIVYALRPDVIIECGVYAGGCTLFLQCLIKLFGHGRVIGVDITLSQVHQRVLDQQPEGLLLIEGSSTAPEVFERVKAEVAGQSTLIILDSNHTYAHVSEELQLYPTLSQVGDYVIVEDTHFDYPMPVANDIYPDGGPGKALDEFLDDRDDFMRDPVFNIHLLTMSPGGAIRRVR
jgi:cephalosporin hydroxylase